MNLNEILTIIPDVTDDELMTLRCYVDAELAGRNITFNVGIMGEKICIAYFNSTPGLSKLLQAPTGAKNVDALSRNGERYSIKTFLKAKKTGTIYPDEKNPEKQLFECLVVVHLDTDYALKAIYKYSWDVFQKVKAWDKRMNAWYVPLSSKNLKLAEIIFHKT